MALPLGSSDSNDIDYENDESDPIPGLNLKFDLSDRVVGDMFKMFREGTFNDVCIKLHDGEIEANKFVLAARCEYFAATFRWKDNNNHKDMDMETIVINDCSKKIMMRIIEYIFSGILKANNLKLLEFLELKDQVRKMFPGDQLEGKIDDPLMNLRGSYILPDKDKRFSLHYPSLAIPPTNEEIGTAVSLVETGNLQPEVLVELARVIESHIMKWNGEWFEENTMALANLVSYGVIESVQHFKLDLRDPLSNYSHLQTLVQCVTGTIDITNVQYSDATEEPYNLVTLFDAVNCKELQLYAEKLNQEETEALVRAMTSRVEILHLNLQTGFDLDHDSFSKYNGDGKCREVRIFNHSDCDLSALLDSVNCKELHLYNETKILRKDETEALVRAITSRVEILHLGSKYEEYKDTVTLDFDALTKYKGDGKCREVHCNNLCIGWSSADDPIYRFSDDDDDDYDDHDHDNERGQGSYLRSDDGFVYGMQDQWMDDESAGAWAEQMNWDFKVINQDGEYLLSRK